MVMSHKYDIDVKIFKFSRKLLSSLDDIAVIYMARGRIN